MNFASKTKTARYPFMAFDSRSPSQIETWEGCPRKYGWSYVVGLRSDPMPSQLLGTEVDDGCLQPYFRDGKPLPDTDAGRIAATALPWLPSVDDAREAGCTQQFKIRLPGAKGAPWFYNGYEDFDVPVGGLLPEWPAKLAHAEDYPAVVDFKTCKTFGYAHDADSLKQNPQAVIYALNTMRRLKVDAVRLRWIYMRTTGKPKAQVTDAVLTAAEATPVFLRIEETAAQIHEYLQKAPDRAYGEIGGPEHEAYVLATPPNPAHCDAYGGCPHRARCNLSPAQITDAAMGVPETTDAKEYHVSATNIKARLEARKAAAAGKPAPTPPTVGNIVVDSVTAKPAKPINPPERGVVVPAPADAPDDEVVVAPKVPRKRRTKAEMAAAREASSNDSETAADEAEDTATNEAIEKLGRAAEVAKDLDVACDFANATFHVTWGEEAYQPEPFNTFRIGPYSAYGTVEPGETLPEAMLRVHGQLATVAVAARAAQAEAFVKTLKATKGGK